MKRKEEHMMEGWVPPFDDKAKAWEAISKRIDAMDSKPKKSIIPMWTKVAAAAAMIAVVAGLFFSQSTATTVNTLAAQQQSVELPDASTVTLNAESTVSFESDWSTERIVTLDGEGFFEVEKGQRFTVQTANGTVSVLGTSFNVYSRGDDFEVICRTGKVQVESNDTEVILTPGLGTDNAQGGLTKAYARENADSWSSGVFVFDEEPISRVFAELERQYAVKIDFSAVNAAHEYSDEIDVHKDDLELVLQRICASYGLKYDFSAEDLTVLITQN